jgi:thioredoxin reductase
MATKFDTTDGLRTVLVMSEHWDCIIVGGGAAGLSAALVLGRARRRTLLVDAGAQSNRAAHGIGGLLGHDGLPPADLYASGRRELAAYPAVEVRDGAVITAASTEGGLTVTLTDGSVELTRHMILATGMDYRLPELPGLAQRWGRSVFHCPFCHGWDVRDRPLGVLDSDPVIGVHRALLLMGWSADVTLLTNGPASVSEEDRDHLRAAGVNLDERRVVAVDGPGDELSTIQFADGTERRCGGLLVPAVLHQRSDLAEQLGLQLTAPNPIAADAIAVGPTGETNIPAVRVAGDASVGMPSLANAIAEGSNAAQAVVRSLLVEHQRLPLNR